MSLFVVDGDFDSDATKKKKQKIKEEKEKKDKNLFFSIGIKAGKEDAIEEAKIAKKKSSW